MHFYQCTPIFKWGHVDMLSLILIRHWRRQSNSCVLLTVPLKNVGPTIMGVIYGADLFTCRSKKYGLCDTIVYYVIP
jgi:hypothetical protein